MIYLTEENVLELLSVAKAIELMEEAFRQLASGAAVNQPRRRVILPTGSALHYMAAGAPRYFGAKIYSTHPRHGAHFLFLLYGSADGKPLAMMEANRLGQIRTGAASGLATRYMARPDASVVGLIGSGFQAEAQIAAMLPVRSIRSFRVWSRNGERRARFAATTSEKFSVQVEATQTAREAIEVADIVITATSAKDPVFDAAWIAPGAHINAMGSNQAQRREMPPEIMGRADVIAVDSIEQAEMESGDLLLARAEGKWDGKGMVELKDIVTGKAPARKSSSGITIFKSNGLAIEDVIAAGYVYEEATARGVGRPVYS